MPPTRSTKRGSACSASHDSLCCVLMCRGWACLAGCLAGGAGAAGADHGRVGAGGPSWEVRDEALSPPSPRDAPPAAPRAPLRLNTARHGLRCTVRAAPCGAGPRTPGGYRRGHHTAATLLISSRTPITGSNPTLNLITRPSLQCAKTHGVRRQPIRTHAGNLGPSCSTRKATRAEPRGPRSVQYYGVGPESRVPVKAGDRSRTTRRTACTCHTDIDGETVGVGPQCNKIQFLFSETRFQGSF